jgi:hypothetical protein
MVSSSFQAGITMLYGIVGILGFPFPSGRFGTQFVSGDKCCCCTMAGDLGVEENRQVNANDLFARRSGKFPANVQGNA